MCAGRLPWQWQHRTPFIFFIYTPGFLVFSAVARFNSPVSSKQSFILKAVHFKSCSHIFFFHLSFCAWECDCAYVCWRETEIEKHSVSYSQVADMGSRGPFWGLCERVGVLFCSRQLHAFSVLTCLSHKSTKQTMDDGRTWKHTDLQLMYNPLAYLLPSGFNVTYKKELYIYILNINRFVNFMHRNQSYTMCSWKWDMFFLWFQCRSEMIHPSCHYVWKYRSCIFVSLV